MTWKSANISKLNVLEHTAVSENTTLTVLAVLQVGTKWFKAFLSRQGTN